MNKDLLPIWARLQMMREGYDFRKVHSWLWLSDNVISVGFWNYEYGSTVLSR